jgi:predicted esterase YcpF (UPF0227 family)
MTIYIHGFGGSGQGLKASLFREYYKSINKPFIAPSLSHIPDLAISTLEELIESYDGKVTLIGSSLGGYYAVYLANKYKIKAVLLNPSTEPFITVKNILDKDPEYYFSYNFIITDKHIGMLKKYETIINDPSLLTVMVQTGDELLDYKKALKKFSNSKQIVDEGGSHFFEDIEKYFETIEKFLEEK